MIKELTTLKELKAFCIEQGINYFKGKESFFIISADNFNIRKWSCFGRDSVKYRIVDTNTVEVEYRENIGQDGDAIRITKYKDVIATFFYDNEDLFIFQKSTDGTYCEDCRYFYLADGDKE